MARHTTRSHLIIHTRPEASAQDELELVRTTGLEIERSESRRENVGQVVELHLRGQRRLHEQALIAVVHHSMV